MNLKFHSTVLLCNDLERQREFYEKFLGQKVIVDLGDYLIFEDGLSLWKLKKEYPITAELGYTYEPIGNRNLELCFETDSFGNAVEYVLTSECRILHNVEEEEWGQYTIRFYDPEGNLVEIGETMGRMVKRLRESGLSVKQIAKKSGIKEKEIASLLV